MHPQQTKSTYTGKDISYSIPSLISGVQNSEGHQELFYQLISSSQDFISLFTIDGELAFLNLAGRNLIGIDLNIEIDQFHSTQLFNPDQYEKLIKDIIPTLMSKGTWSGVVAIQSQHNLEEIPC